MARHRIRSLVGVTAVTGLVALTGCGDAEQGGTATAAARSINVIMTDNPQMKDLAELVDEHFTKKTGIKVNLTLAGEADVREKITQDVATQSGVYDVATIGAYEAPIWASRGWLHELSSTTEGDAAYDAGDLLAPMVQSLTGSDGKLYAVPFYGESSMLMYRKDVFAAEGLRMPERPTWRQVADLAAKADGSRPGMKGICLRGLPSWGQVFAPMTTVVNTFGGTWFDEDWKARVNSPAFVEAAEFYVDLVRAHGQPDPAEAGFAECLEAMGGGKVAMWYDATSAAGLLEDGSTSRVVGKVGYVYAPVERTKSSGWLWTWALSVPSASKNTEDAATFVKWATGKEYERLVGETLGWSRVPSGKRASTYSLPEYRQASAAFGDITLKAIQEADPVNPGLQPRPAAGIQFVAIPEFADLATRISHNLADAFEGTTTVRAVLNQGQSMASEVALIHRSS
ncbi:ABC transporter substrate-binding protein [Planomonospora sp. ID82291]|uniref:ABC transporter substrate-binding protein n=1 Tax=Planomonospora sp. ID82291 TaxID=2738136 RepID=UPI0018C4418E|nr:sugar ABC transporter substrate-binding protein [Planomonospora sp. ID82291]MBG0816595.1 sugar ABC transporter substrate-binding protein [Planomonospora sp. ID82291]